jgi:hypothetical protein
MELPSRAGYNSAACTDLEHKHTDAAESHTLRHTHNLNTGAKLMFVPVNACHMEVSTGSGLSSICDIGEWQGQRDLAPGVGVRGQCQCR